MGGNIAGREPTQQFMAPLSVDTNGEAVKPGIQNDSERQSVQGYAYKPFSSDNEEADDPQEHSKRERARSIGHKAKSKAKRALHIDTFEDAESNPPSDSLEDEVRQNPAFNPEKVYAQPKPALRERGKHLIETTKAIGHAAVDPKDSAKQMIAKKLATTERPFVSREADAAYLEALERVDRIHSDLTDTEEEEADDKLEDGRGGKRKRETRESELKRSQARKESLQAAWITSRYVQRVRVVENERIRWRSLDEFRVYGDDGNLVKTRWDGYLAHMALYYAQDPGLSCVEDTNDIPYDRDTLLRQVERIVIASHGWQSWLLSLRQLYRWEDPRRTGKWLAIYLVLWYNNYILTFWWAYGAYIVLQNRYNNRSLGSLRRSRERTLDGDADAFRLGELIAKHGHAHWLDPLEENAGPVAQVQLQDVADFLEVLNNYYEWRDPRMTAATLFFMAVCVFIGITTPTEFSLKIALWIGLLFFFLGRPVASHAPRFRHLISPLKWVYWGIPTDAEWSLRYLRDEAIGMRVRDSERLNGQKTGQNSYVANEKRSTSKYSLNSEHGFRGDESDSGSVSSASSTASFFSASSKSVASHSTPPPFLDSRPLITFRARSGSHAGHLHLTASSIIFTSITHPSTSSPLWSYPYASLVELRKTKHSAVSTGAAAIVSTATLGAKNRRRKKVLEMHFRDEKGKPKESGEAGMEMLEDGTREKEHVAGPTGGSGERELVERVSVGGGARAEEAAFNRILGFSGLEWRVLPPVRSD